MPETIVHPWHIKNDEELCIPDYRNNLIGTGTNEQFEKNCVDKYLKPDVRERKEFKVINQ